jgi:hypothetical protein
MPKFLPDEVAQKERKTIYLSPSEASYLGLPESEDLPLHISLKYFDGSYECFSEWQRGELKAFTNFIDKLREHNWERVRRTPGFGYTEHNRQHLPRKRILTLISPDTTLFELRVTQKARVHGFKVQSVFFLVWLDRNHEIYRQ